MSWHFAHVLKWPHKNLNLTKEILNSWKLWNERCSKVDLYRSTDSAMSSGSQCGYFWAPWLLFSIFKPAKGHGGHDFDEGVWTLQKRALGIFFWPCENVKPRWNTGWRGDGLGGLGGLGRWPQASSSKSMILHWHVWYVGLPILKGVIMNVKKHCW